MISPLSGDMAEKQVDLESHLNRAREQEKKYDWSGAADSYKQALDSLPGQDAQKKGEAQEALAHALYKMAFQADSPEEFRRRLDRATAEYQIAKDLYAELDDERGRPKESRCESMIAFSSYWRATDASEKKRFVEQTWTLAKDALKGFDRLSNPYDLGKTYNDLVLAAWAVFAYTDEFEARRSIASEILSLGEEAVEMLSRTTDSLELGRAYLNTCHAFSCIDSEFPDADDMTKYSRRRREFWLKGYQRLENAALGEIAGMAPLYGLPIVDGQDEASGILKRMVEQSGKTHDKLLIGFATEWFARSIYLESFVAEFPETRELAGKNAIEKMVEANKNFSAVSFTPFVTATANGRANVWPPTPGLGVGFTLAYFEPDLDKKRKLAKQALDVGEDQLRLALRSGYPDAIGFTHCLLACGFATLAKTEKDPSTKRKLLDEFIEHGKKWTEYHHRVAPGDHADMAGYTSCLADAEFELAEITGDAEERKRLLRIAAGRGKEVYDMFMRTARPGERILVLPFLGGTQRDFGHYLVRLFELTSNEDDLRSALESFGRASKGFLQAGDPVRSAECSWEKAQIHDLLKEQLKASEEFLQASEFYKKSAEKHPQLIDLYQDHALYMQAWSEIELARYHHDIQELASAQEHFNKAAELHRSTVKWSFLSTNYFAWAQVENAEDLSQKEQSKESIDTFREAAKLFEDSKSKMREQLAKIESKDEKKMVERLIDASDSRQELCRARIALEEARLLDKEGNLSSASEKYGLAADMFTRIKQRLTSEQDRREIELIITLSKAWKAMAKAESKSSPELYEEAAHLFDVAKDLSPGDKSTNLAMGHSRFCKALQAGVNFSDTGDLAQHEIATDNLESAGKYYLKAGLISASEYARASKLLFDAYAQMSRASKEEDHEKRAKLYTLTEKILQASATSYEKADQAGKKEQVLNLLAKVQQDRELAVSLAEILHAPDAVSTTKAFSSPTPTHETAAGLDRFEHAEIQATLVVRPKDLLVGEDFNLEIELVNAGRGFAQLTKVEDVIPHGFDVKEISEKYRIEDSYLNLRGRRLDALKTEDVKVVLKPTVHGRFRLKPRVMYLDETGKYRSYEPEPVDVTVKELGISGWLKGSEKRR